MRAIFQKQKLAGSVPAIPSKSYAHRLMLAAALAQGESILHGILDSADVCATLDCIRALGATVIRDGETLYVRGVGGVLPKRAVFPCRESGSTLRFFLPLLCATGGQARCEGSERLLARGIGVYEELFAQNDVIVEKTPTTVRVFGKLCAGEYTVRGDVSSQFVTGLLFMLSQIAGNSTLRVLPPIESRPYLDITLDVLRQFGATITERETGVFTVCGGVLQAQEAFVEGDWSNAAALLAFAAIGRAVTVTGLSPKSLQGDRVCRAYFQALDAPGAVLDLSNCPDLAPILFAVAACKQGATFTGTARLRIKESDRTAAMASELAKCGVRCELEADRVRIYAGFRAPSTPLLAHNDHRIVMALSFLLLQCGGVLEGIEAIDKSYPAYFTHLAELGAEVRYEA